MSEVIKMIQDITKFEDLQQFANTQYKVMIAQAKKIEKLDEEITKLQVQLEQEKQKNLTSSTLDTKNDNQNDAETICLIQLALLNNKSMLGELTLEETKKVETYSKVLLSLKVKDSNNDKEKEIVENIDTSNLLSIIGQTKSADNK